MIASRLCVNTCLCYDTRMELTKEQRIAKHKDFLKANWIILAAFSWEHFQTQESIRVSP